MLCIDKLSLLLMFNVKCIIISSQCLLSYFSHFMNIVNIKLYRKYTNHLFCCIICSFITISYFLWLGFLFVAFTPFLSFLLSGRQSRN